MDQDNIWDTFQNDESLIDVGFPAKRRLEFIVKNISSGSNVLNIGVGSGYLEDLLVRKGMTVSCLDPSVASIERIAERLSLGERAKVGYSQSLPFSDGAFDYVVMSEVLEHLESESFVRTLEEVRRVLCQGGKFIGTVPADEDLLSSLVVCPCCSTKFHRWGHIQSFSESRLSADLLALFDKVKLKRMNFVDFDQLNWKGKLIGIVNILQATMGVCAGNQNFYFEAVK